LDAAECVLEPEAFKVSTDALSKIAFFSSFNLSIRFATSAVSSC
jgi:hypothetical protein